MSGITIEAYLRREGFELDVAMQLPAEGVTAILGPSGSGKSTLLRIIAGLERAQRGRIKVGGRYWMDAQRGVCLAPQRRRAGMVFQDYALFEHMSVARNIGYGLARQGREATVEAWLERLHLEGLAARYPRQLSGGQRQRVALARALAPEPDVLLLDEPLSAVDTHLRQQLRAQLLEVVDDLAQPVLLVTHDLDEVRVMAAHTGVMVDGRLHCLGATDEVFNHPPDGESARVLGWRNLLPVQAIDGPELGGPWGRIRLDHEPAPDTRWLGVRAEHIRLSHEASGVSVQVMQVTELGAVRELRCRLPDGSCLYVHRPWNEPLPTPGAQVRLELPVQHLRPLAESRTRASDVIRELEGGEVSSASS